MIKMWLNIVVFVFVCGCQRGSESPEELVKEMLSAVGDADKILALMPSKKQLSDIMECSSDNHLLTLLENQRGKLEETKNEKAGFRLQYKSTEILKKQKVEKGESIPFSLSKCKAKTPLAFAKIKGSSDYSDDKVKMPKDTEFSAVQIKGKWLLFLLSVSEQ